MELMNIDFAPHAKTFCGSCFKCGRHIEHVFQNSIMSGKKKTRIHRKSKMLELLLFVVMISIRQKFYDGYFNQNQVID